MVPYQLVFLYVIIIMSAAVEPPQNLNPATSPQNKRMGGHQFRARGPSRVGLELFAQGAVALLIREHSVY